MVPSENHCPSVSYMYSPHAPGVYNTARTSISSPILAIPCDKLYNRLMNKKEDDPALPKRIRKSFTVGANLGASLKKSEGVSRERVFQAKGSTSTKDVE